MRLQSRTVYRITSLLSAMAFGLSGLQAYEQGSYLILDIVEKKTEDPTQVARLQIEQKYFEASILPKTKASNADEISSEFLVGLEQQSTTPDTFNESYFGDVKMPSEASLFGTDTTPQNKSSFGTDTTSVFGQ